MSIRNITVNKIKSTYHWSLVLLLFWGAISCKSTMNDYSDYMKYIANPDNGLTKTQTTSGLKISVKYLPIDYLAYTELKNSQEVKTKEEKELLKKAYENSLTFMLTFAPDEGKTFDVTKVGVANYEEFAERIENMNFNFSNYIKLETEKEEFQPELTQMESTYGLEKKRNIVLVFNRKNIQDDTKIVYKDEIFGTGTHRFLFKKEDLTSIPQFVF